MRTSGLVLRSSASLFLEYEVAALQDIRQILNGKDQSLSYFGFERAELLALVRTLPNRAIDRVVPIGRALQFSDTWDGFQLLESFTRRVEVL